MKGKIIRLATIADLKDPSYKEALREVTVVNRIEALLEDMNTERLSMKTTLEIGDKERRVGVFSASDVGLDNGRSLDGEYVMACGRYLYYCYTNQKAQKAYDPRLRRIFDTGSAVHAQLQMYLHECANREGATFEEEVDGDPENNSYSLSMHMDGRYIITRPELIVKFGVEIKSINDAGYKATRKIHDNHATQGTIYQKIFDLPAMLFLYYNKNDSSMSEHIQLFDRKRWKAIKAKLNMVREHDIKGTIPPYEVSFKCKMCKFAKTVCKPPQKASAAETRRLFQAHPKTVLGGR